MSLMMDNTSQFKDFNGFLAKHSAKNVLNTAGNAICTHTRIPDKDLNIYAGSYVIPKEELSVFHGLYYNHIFEKKNKEYLTERQLESGGPIAVDFDFRYSSDVIERPHNKDNVADIVCQYLEELKEHFVFEDDAQFPIYIFEKPHVNRLADKSFTKDGIHMIIGISTDHIVQTMIRDKMLTVLPDCWDFPLINAWDAVLDEGITKGTTNWQLFGSRKPGNEAYEFTNHYVITIDPSDKNFIMSDRNVSDFNL